MNTIKRAALNEVLAASSEFPALIVTGARQVGKTTLLKAADDCKRRFVSLDVLTVRDLARRDPSAFLSVNALTRWAMLYMPFDLYASMKRKSQ